jgi:hypothetical protein
MCLRHLPRPRGTSDRLYSAVPAARGPRQCAEPFAGVPPSEATQATGSNGQVGKLQLTAQQEQDFVNFLSTLSNGFTKPNPVSE